MLTIMRQYLQQTLIVSLFLLSATQTVHAAGTSSPSALRQTDEQTYPAIATAILSRGSRAVDELDLIDSVPDDIFLPAEQQGNKVSFIVQSDQEVLKISNLQGLVNVQIDPQANADFFAKNERFGGAGRANEGGGGGGTRGRHLQANRQLQTYSTISGYSCYRNLAGSFQLLDDLETQFPTLVTVSDIGDSWLKTTSTSGTDGHDIKVLKITAPNPNASTKGIMFAMFGIHAREMAPPELGMRFAEHLVNGYGTDPDVTAILEHTEIHLVLQSNPDGRAADEVRQNFRRKNMNSLNGDAVTCGSQDLYGVDLNRNFPFKWGLAGASSDPCAATYRGPSPASEPEVQAISNYLDTLFPTSQRKVDPEGNNLNDAYADDATGMFYDIHSYSELNIYPWSWLNAKSNNDEQLQTLARKFKSFNNYALSGPTQPDFLYVVSGATADYAYGALGASSSSLELGTAFYQTCSVFEDTIFPTNLPVLLYGAKVARTPYKTPLGPDVMSFSAPLDDAAVIPSIPQSETLSVIAEVSDSARSTFTSGKGRRQIIDGIATGEQTIASVTLYVDEHPEDDLAVPAPVGSAMIGSFQSGTETAQIDIVLSGYAVGRHILHIQAVDSDGFAGPISSRFFDVCDPSVEGCAPPPVTCLATGEGTGCNSSTDCCSGVGNCSGGNPNSRTCL